MKVRAIEKGFYGGHRRDIGDVFEVADGAKGKWFVPVEPQEPKPEAKPRRVKATPAAEDGAGDLV